MEDSVLYFLLEKGLLPDWKDMAEENDFCGFAQAEKEILQELTEGLNEAHKGLLRSYSIAVENRKDFACHNLNIKILNLGIKIGMELNKAFEEYER